MARNLGDLLVARGAPARVVLIETGPDGRSTRAALSAADLDGLVNAVARGLLRHGLQRDDRIGILALNRIEFVAAYLGAMRAGIVVVPINWKLPAETVEYITRDADVSLLFVDEPRAGSVPSDLRRISFDGPEWESFLDPGPFNSVVPDDVEIAQILYTSGSTGQPKGVPLTHAGQRWAVEVTSVGDNSSHRILVAAPMFHMNALINLKFALHNGACCVLMPSFSARAYIEAITEHRITWITAVPTMLAMLANAVGDGPVPPAFRKVTRVFMGSSPFGQSLLDRVCALFPNAQVSNGYGTTEAGPAVFGPHPAGLPTPDLSMGHALKGVELRLVDETGRVIEGAGTGVLQMRTPALTPGYLNLPERTKVAIRDGWYHTNDIVRRDENGFHFFVGRSDDMFVSGGENIYPGEVEKVLERHPGVHQAVVVPVPDVIKQTLPVAFVVRGNSTEPVSEDELKAWTLRHAPAYQHPRWIEFIEAMPLAGTNKVDRNGLARWAELTAPARRR